MAKAPGRINLNSVRARKPAAQKDEPAEAQDEAPAAPVKRGRGRPLKNVTDTGEKAETIALTLRVDAETYEAFASLAAHDRIKARVQKREAVSMNDLLREALNDWLAKRAARD